MKDYLHKILKARVYDVAKETPSSTTPAFARANNGIIPKATYGDKKCSNFNNIKSRMECN